MSYAHFLPLFDSQIFSIGFRVQPCFQSLTPNLACLITLYLTYYLTCLHINNINLNQDFDASRHGAYYTLSMFDNIKIQLWFQTIVLLQTYLQLVTKNVPYIY